MRPRVTGLSCCLLLAGPIALSFFSGGYFDEPRAWAGAIAWALVVVAMLLGPQPIPRGTPARLTLAALLLFAIWTLLSLTWAPVAGDAYHRGQLAFLYAGGLIAAASLLRDGRWARVAEPALAAGCVLVIGYGLAERVLPGALHFAHSLGAYGRLEQPLTYWNAMGELAAIGLVLCLRLAGDSTRRPALRSLATAAATPLGIGLYASFSRGALFACFAGVVTLIVVAPTREAWRSGALALVLAIVSAGMTAPFKPFTSLTGSRSAAETDGAVVLALAVVVMVAGALLQLWLIRREAPAAVRLSRRAAWLALAVVCAGLAVSVVAGAKEKSSGRLGTGAGRLATLQSNRYDYWRVALRAFGDEPLRGVGAGGWSVYWLRYRTIREGASDAHSLPLQTLAELGVVGGALLAAFLGGGVLVARRALVRAPALAAGPIAGAVVYLSHSPLDWDWEMPAVTLVALALLGLLVGLADDPAVAASASGSRSVQIATGA